VILIDCIRVRIGGGQVANRPIYVALAVTCDGMREILGLWAVGCGLWAVGGGRGAKCRLHVLAEVEDRGVADVCTVVCDGLEGLPGAIGAVWPRAVTRTCVVHLLRASFRYAVRRDRDAPAEALRPVYTAAAEEGALERFVEFEKAWGRKYPAVIKLWNTAWAEFVPFLNFDVGIRRVVCTTNAIESINARIRRAVRARGHLPNGQAALERVCLAVMSLDPTRHRAETLDEPVESGAERLRDHLRRTPVRRPQVEHFTRQLHR
jgi:putative transposase